MAVLDDAVDADVVADLELKGFSTATTAYAVQSCRGTPTSSGRPPVATN